jgi:hypothetical protein
MQPIIIITPGAIVAAAVLLAAVPAFRAALTRRVPQRHRVREMD